MTFWTLVMAIVAAITGSLVARWTWLDQPQHAWRVRSSRERWRQAPRKDGGVDLEPVDFDSRHQMDIEVHAEGTAIVHEVRVRPVGCELAKSARLRMTRMTAGSEPIELTVWLSSASDGDAYVEIRWLRSRPVREFGERVNLRTHSYERWRWRWRTVRLRRRENAPWWRSRPVRTGGHWVPGRRTPLVSLPESEVAQADSR